MTESEKYVLRETDKKKLKVDLDSPLNIMGSLYSVVVTDEGLGLKVTEMSFYWVPNPVYYPTGPRSSEYLTTVTHYF